MLRSARRVARAHHSHPLIKSTRAGGRRGPPARTRAQDMQPDCPSSAAGGCCRRCRLTSQEQQRQQQQEGAALHRALQVLHHADAITLPRLAIAAVAGARRWPQRLLAARVSGREREREREQRRRAESAARRNARVAGAAAAAELPARRCGSGSAGAEERLLALRSRAAERGHFSGGAAPYCGGTGEGRRYTAALATFNMCVLRVCCGVKCAPKSMQMTTFA